MELLLILLLLCFLLYVPGWCRLDYKCFPNATLVVTNPDTNLTVAEVTDSFNECRHSFSDDFSLLTLDYCRMGTYVTVMFLKKNTEIYSKNSFAGPYRIMCKDIPLEGVMISINVHLRVPYKEDNIPEVPEMIQVVSALKGGVTIKTQAVVLGDERELQWTFTVPGNHTAIPEECTAYPGITSSGGVGNILMHNGCSKDLKFMTDFSGMTSSPSGDNKLYSTTIVSFRYSSSNFVTIVCTMRICEDESETNCMMDCSNPFRARRTVRSVPRDEFEDIVLTIQVFNDHTSAAPPSSVGGSLNSIFSLALPAIFHLTTG